MSTVAAQLPNTTEPPTETPTLVKVGQLLMIDGGSLNGTTLRITEYGAYNAVAEAVTVEVIVTTYAECRHCHFTAEIASEDDSNGFEFRVWNHEQSNPVHVIGYRVETERNW